MVEASAATRRHASLVALPGCQRRREVLPAIAPEVPVRCRACLKARYVGNYPGRSRDWRFARIFRSLLAAGSIAERQERAHRTHRGPVDLVHDSNASCRWSRRR